MTSSNSLDLILSLAWRNLWRNRRRTLVILFAIILGVWAMIVTAAFMRGMVYQMLEDSVDNLAGHIQVHQVNYRDDPVVVNAFSPSDELLQYFSQDDRVLIRSDRVRVPAVISSERESAGVTLIGIDPEAELKISFIGKAEIEGRFLTGSDDKGIVIGRALAEKLDTGVGKRVVLMSQDTHNEIADRGFRIIGVYDAPIEATEKAVVFAGKAVIGKLLRLEEQVTETVFRVHEVSDIDALLANAPASTAQVRAISWLEAEPYLKLMITMMDSFMFVWYLIVFIAMAFGIVNTLLMAVFERTREFGLFQALGQQPRFILGQVWLEALLMIIVGLVLGNLFAWISVIATGDGIDVSVFARGMEMLNMSNVIPFVITFKDLLVANITVAVLGMITGFYPAWRASRLVPADALTRV